LGALKTFYLLVLCAFILAKPGRNSLVCAVNRLNGIEDIQFDIPKLKVDIQPSLDVSIRLSEKKNSGLVS
jgi:hypothetical protein